MDSNDYRKPIDELARLISSDSFFKDYQCKIRQCWDGWQLILIDPDRKEIDDAVCHGFSNGSEKGLLETYSLSDCDGYEMPLEVYLGWKNLIIYG